MLTLTTTNGQSEKQEPFVYMRHVLKQIAGVGTLEKQEALLLWNMPLEAASKNVAQYDFVRESI